MFQEDRLMDSKALMGKIFKWLWLAVRVALVVGAACVAIVFALIVIPGGRNYLPVSMQQTLADANVDNSYIDNGFEGWYEVAPEGFSSFRIPEQWELSVRSGTYRLLNADTTMAYGTSFGTELDPYDSMEAFFSSFVSFEIVSIQRSEVSGFYDVGGCDLIIVTVRGDDALEAQYHYLTLQNGEGPTLAFAFPHGGMTQSKIQEIAQAIAYDYIF